MQCPSRQRKISGRLLGIFAGWRVMGHQPMSLSQALSLAVSQRSRRQNSRRCARAEGTVVGMIIKPKIRGFICTTAHPVGCAAHVREQIAYARSKGSIDGMPKRVLVIGSSTGYGLASRIVPAFAGGAATLGVFFEREAEEGRTGTAGWYNSAAFQSEAHAAGLYAKSINGDAFSDAIKEQTIATIKADLGQVDAVIYSLASPRRQSAA